MVQSDCKVAIDMIKTEKIENAAIATLREDIQQLKEMIEQYVPSFIYRLGNMCAYSMT